MTNNKKLIFVLLFLLFISVLYGISYRQKYLHIGDNWMPKSWCSDEEQKNINFLLNSEQNIFDKARAILALKENGCLSEFPTLVTAATELINQEKEIIKTSYKEATYSVDLIVKFEKENIIADATKEGVLKEKTETFSKELEKRAMKLLDEFSKK